ncbi:MULTISPECIES: methyltransferase domain-containing protein [unclassified Serratia (in: enterobacteria)]|uniref:methyltransferase domain-containing protein n=1 Tax=unclassified Serratia (in: enterobacteria) TaxID=2647522 RepID=UPI000469B436|nr:MULTISPECIES: methyltransferase domain-containing protein [unclassified Serratia (in: enterobacteria)]
MNFEHSTMFDEYWNDKSMNKMKNIENAFEVSEEILNSCGGRKFLDLGCGKGELVQSLLSLGMDAYGVDVSDVAVRHGNVLMPNRFEQCSIDKLPFADRSFDTTIATYSLEYLSAEQLKDGLKEIRRVTRRSVYLRIRTAPASETDIPYTAMDRNAWEMAFFDAGFRKHPSYYLINDYEALGREGAEITLLLECIPDEALARYPLEALKEERDLHMDMTREAGERSDAHIARYQWAASFVRPGDTVLDAACGLGYGSYLIQCGTMASKTLGIDGSDYAIHYARHNFSSRVQGLDFAVGMLPEALKVIADNSVDVVISFETLEHVPEPQALLAEFHRVLTPAGRIIVSVPNDWSDETGEDPNPFHLHVYTLDKLRDEMKAHYEFEQLVVQSATHYKNGVGSKEWVPAKRELYAVSGDISVDEAPKAEWWLAVGMKPSIEGEAVPYRQTQFKTFADKEWNVTAFARDYKNPWLVRGMVDIGHRLKDQDKLLSLCEEVYARNHDNSADTGAALCVIGYQLLSTKPAVTFADLTQFERRVEEYINAQPMTPHGFRWVVSLHFVIGKLWLKTGSHDKAKDAFEKCIALNPLEFSPLLANRTVEACQLLGVIALNRGDKAQASHYWRQGILLAQQAISADWKLSLGDVSEPVEFGLPELSSILDYASTCAYALVNIDSFEDKPWWWLQLRRNSSTQNAIMGRKINSLNKSLHDKDSALSSVSFAGLVNGEQTEHLLTALSTKEKIAEEIYAALLSKDSHLNELGKTMLDKDAAMNELLSELHNNNQQTEHLVSTLMAKDDVITHLNQTLLLKEQALVEQLNTIQQLNGQLNSRLIRLRNVAAQPFSLRKVLHMGYLMTSLVTPRRLRHYLAPLITRLRVRFAKRPVVSVSTDGQPEKAKQGHQVLVPQSKENAPKIVHVIANFMTGGSSRLVVDLIEYLGAEYKQSIITSYIPDPPAYLGVDIEECRFPEDTMPFIEYYQRLKPDFIHVHYWGDVDEPWYAKAIEAARELDIPVIENINTPIAPHLSPAVKRYVYVSDYVRHVFGQSNDSHVTVYPGSDFSHFMRADEEAVPQDCVGMVYRLEGDKLNEAAIEPFIRIVQKRPQTKILIVGGGSLLAPFQQAVKEAGVEDNFEFTGYVEYSTLPEYYRRMSLFVAPVWKESFGQVSPFAMNMRVPVIGYDIGAISEIVNSKAMLAPARDADKLADIAITLLDDEARRAELGKEHQQRAEGNFSIQAMIDAYDHLYADMIKK